MALSAVKARTPPLLAFPRGTAHVARLGPLV